MNVVNLLSIFRGKLKVKIVKHKVNNVGTFSQHKLACNYLKIHGLSDKTSFKVPVQDKKK